MNNFSEKANFIWSVADLLRGPYKPNQYKDVTLPMILLTQHHAISDPETGGSYTVKKYRSEKEPVDDGTWQHTQITLESLNPEYGSIQIDSEEAEDLKIIAEFLEIQYRGDQ